MRSRAAALANLTLVNSGPLSVTWVNVTHALPEGYAIVGRVSAFVEVNGTTYRVHPRDMVVEAEGGVVRVLLNLSSGVRLLGRGGVRRIRALEPGWALTLHYRLRPAAAVEPGRYPSTVLVEYEQESVGMRSLRIAEASAELVVRPGGRGP